MKTMKNDTWANSPIHDKIREAGLDNCEREAKSGSDATACYRLLDCNDEIRGDDEFLEDDAVTWTRIDLQHRWNIGSFWHSALKPMRRILCDNETSPSTGATEKEKP